MNKIFKRILIASVMSCVFVGGAVATEEQARQNWEANLKTYTSQILEEKQRVFSGNGETNGITNFNGSSCYFNSVMQFLNASKLIREAIKNGAAKNTLANILKDVFDKLANGPLNGTEARTAFNSIQQIIDPGKSFMNGSQQDSSEVVLKIFEKLGGIMEPLLHGESTRKIVCDNGHVTESTQQAPSPYAITVGNNTHHLEVMTQPEEIDGYSCATCRTKVKATKTDRSAFVKLPKLLVFSLERHDPVNHAIKNSKPVYFDEHMELKDNKGLHEYILTSTINHGGTGLGGHYTATVRGNNGKWSAVSDSSVTPISSDTLPIGYVNNTSYTPTVLLYEEIDSASIPQQPVISTPPQSRAQSPRSHTQTPVVQQVAPVDVPQKIVTPKAQPVNTGTSSGLKTPSKQPQESSNNIRQVNGKGPAIPAKNGQKPGVQLKPGQQARQESQKKVSLENLKRLEASKNAQIAALQAQVKASQANAQLDDNQSKKINAIPAMNQLERSVTKKVVNNTAKAQTPAPIQVVKPVGRSNSTTVNPALNKQAAPLNTVQKINTISRSNSPVAAPKQILRPASTPSRLTTVTSRTATPVREVNRSITPIKNAQKINTISRSNSPVSAPKQILRPASAPSRLIVKPTTSNSRPATPVREFNKAITPIKNAQKINTIYRSNNPVAAPKQVGKPIAVSKMVTQQKPTVIGNSPARSISVKKDTFKMNPTLKKTTTTKAR